ncbi:MAG: LPS export ABC transporter periplasmic protein LptC [Psychrobacter sp.]|nr:LPS export ABC transporter periplasmic protein LptC [Psychrobacter sp.]
MNARVLIVLALVIAAAAGWFFHQQGSAPPVVNIKPSEVDYEATDIKAVQTNDQGETEYQLDADSLKHNPTTNLDEISGLRMDWAPGSEQRYQIQAGSAAINQQSGELKLTGGFVLTSQGSADGKSSKPIKVTGQSLFGNTKERKVYSKEPVKVIQGDNRFEAGSMQADLEAGEYEFGQIAVTFDPPSRQDQKLF